MNFNQLRGFYSVAKNKSFSLAAKELRLTQPTISTRVQLLERTYGIKLFKKVGRELVLTEMGEILFSYAEKIFELSDELESRILDYSQLKQGTLNIGSTRLIAKYLVPDLIRVFNREHPGLKICLWTGLSHHILKKVMDCQCDIGIIGRVEYPRDIIRREISSQRLVLIASTKYKDAPSEGIRIGDLTGESVIMREQGSATRDYLLRRFQERRVNPKVVLESENPDAIKRSVELGVGVAFFPFFGVQEELERGAFKQIDLLDEDLAIKIDVIYLRDRRKSSIIRAFMNILSEFPFD